MSEVQDGKEPKQPVQRTTFCIRFHGDEKDAVAKFAKENGKSLTQFIRQTVLEKCGIQPSR